jgi:peptidyl-prolyl cis-trans isomerase C
MSTAAFVACKSNKQTAVAGESKPATANLPPGLPGQSQEDLARAVATIDGTPITVAELQDRINKQSPYVRARYNSLEQKKEFLDTIIRFEILAREAKKRGYDEDPEVVRTMKQVMIQRLLKEEFENRVKPEDIADDEMKKYFEAHLSDYNKPEEVRISAIIVKEKGRADKAAGEARAPSNQDSKAFRDLVDKYSEDADSKARGGDMRFFTADSTALPPEVVKAAFALKGQGDVAGPIQTTQGYYVIKQTGVRKEIKKTFEEVKRQIQNRLYRDQRNEAMETFVSDLKKAAAIEVKDDALARVQIDNSTPPPGGADLDSPRPMMPGAAAHGAPPPAHGAPPPAHGTPPAKDPATK